MNTTQTARMLEDGKVNVKAKLALLWVAFWLLGARSGDAWRRAIPINFSISALMVVCPLIAAAILAYGE